MRPCTHVKLLLDLPRPAGMTADNYNIHFREVTLRALSLLHRLLLLRGLINSITQGGKLRRVALVRICFSFRRVADFFRVAQSVFQRLDALAQGFRLLLGLIRLFLRGLDLYHLGLAGQ